MASRHIVGVDEGSHSLEKTLEDLRRALANDGDKSLGAWKESGPKPERRIQKNCRMRNGLQGKRLDIWYQSLNGRYRRVAA